MGPAMRKLSPQQRAFVMAYLETGLKATAAARLSGYGGENPQSVRVQAHRLTRNEDILAAIKELADRKVKTGAYIAMSVLLEIAQDPSHKDRYKAAVEIANRSGMIVAQKMEVEHKHEMDAKEVIAQLKAFAKELGLNERQVLGSAGYTDAQFELVSPPVDIPVKSPDADIPHLSEERTQISDKALPQLTGPQEPAMSTAGLEDLL